MSWVLTISSPGPVHKIRSTSDPDKWVHRPLFLVSGYRLEVGIELGPSPPSTCPRPSLLVPK